MVWFRRLGSVLLILLIALLLLEAILQLGAAALRLAGREPVQPWQTEGVRVLALGDSNTYGLYHPLEQAWPARFEAHWNAANPQQPVSVLNLAYPGTNSARVLANLPRLLDKTRPDWVFVMVGNNDFWTPAEDPQTVDDPPFHWQVWLNQHSRAYRLVFMLQRSMQGFAVVSTRPRTVLDEALLADHAEQRRLNEAMAESLRQAAAQVQKPQKPQPRQVEALWVDGDFFEMQPRGDQAPAGGKVTPGNLQAISRVAREHGVSLLFLTYPSSNPFYPASSRSLRQVAESEARPLIDLEAQMRTLCADDPEDGCPTRFLADKAHPNARGYDDIGQFVAARFHTVLREGVAP